MTCASNMRKFTPNLGRQRSHNSLIEAEFADALSKPIEKKIILHRPCSPKIILIILKICKAV